MPYRNPNRYNDYERYANDNRRNYYPEDFNADQQNAHTRWRHHDDRFYPQQHQPQYRDKGHDWQGPHHHQPMSWRGEQPPQHRPERPYWRHDRNYSQADQHTSDRWPQDHYTRDRFANPDRMHDRRRRRNEEW